MSNVTIYPIAPADIDQQALLAAMVAFPMNPGHSDLDNEQPIAVVVGDGFVFVSLGERRTAQREART